MGKNKVPKRQKVQQKLYTEKDIDDAIRKGAESSAMYNVYLTMGSVLKALHDLYGFGEVRCNRLIDSVMSIEFNTISVSELLDEVQEKTKVDLRKLEANRNEYLL